MALFFDTVEINDRIQLDTSYIQPNGTWLRHQTTNGYIDIGPANTSHAHIYTDRSNFYFNKQIQLLGVTLINQNDIRSSIFYDVDNTAYYLNPASGNATNALKIKGEIYRDGFDTTSNGGNNKILVSQDYSSWIWNTATNWGIFWAGNDNAAYTYFTGTNPNELNFVGGGSVKASIDLDNGQSYFATSVRSPIFYDSDNTNYNTDPAGTSNLYKIWVKGSAANSAPRWDTSFHVVQSQNWYGHTNTQTMYLGESGNISRIRGRVRIGNDADPQSGYDLSVNNSIHMNNSSVNYVNQLHFNDNVRFYDDNNDNYLNFKYGSSSNGGIKFLNGSAAQQGYLYASTSGFGLLSADGTWAVQTTDSTTTIDHRLDTPIVYDSDNTAYYLNPAGTSTLNQCNASGFLVDGTYDGLFGFTGMSWGGSTSYPTLYSGHSDRWVMHIKPHIVWTENGQRGYTGSTQGSLMRFEGNLASNRTWDIGCLTSIASGGDYFGVVRNYGSATWAFYADPSCNLHANTSMRAPIFYDSNNTDYYVNPASSSNLQKVTIVGTANGNDPTLKITSTTSNTFNHAIEAFNSNLTTGEHNIVLFGKEGNTKNSGYIGYYWSAAASNNNFVTIGHWGADDLFRVYPDQITGNSSFRAPIFYDINNTGYYIHGDDTSRLNILNVNAVGTSVSGIGKVMFPYGAEYSSGSTTGAIKITLPQSWTNTMMTMKITIFDYSINESFEVHCGGYNHTGSGGYWVNTHAKIIANGAIDRNFNVRFGHDGSKCCILIGETTSAWAYPKVVVTEWIGGHSAETFSNWDNGWDISIVTTLPSNIDQTRSNNQIGRYQSIIYDADNTGYYLNADGTSNLNEVVANRVECGYNHNVANSIGCSDWFRSSGSTGWYNGTYAGGIYMTDSTWVRTYNDKRLYTASTSVSAIHTAGGVHASTNLRGNIFYDVNDTAYFCDPNASSILNVVRTTALGVGTAADGAASTGGILKVQGATNGVPGLRVDSAAYSSAAQFHFGYNGSGIGVNNGAGYNSAGISFKYGTTFVGSININSTSTSYNTSSDYRLKENLTPITDGIERVKLLQPKRFNFIGEEATVDGFVAHETQEVVPEAVSGEKDAVDHEGNPEYQGIDQAKLVPLLTAALQEAIAKIESLESRIQVLENQ